MKKLTPEQIEELGKELLQLSRKQSEALQTSAYIRMTAEEARAYDKRRGRMVEICEALNNYVSLTDSNCAIGS
jgi:hypothetical protein